MEATGICLILCLWILSTETSLAQKGQHCSPLPYTSLENGNIQIIAAGKFRFKCKSGYFLGSPEIVRCRDGNWTSTRTPVCLKAEGRCEPPTRIPNARIYGNNFRVGSSVQYMCHDGYKMLGEGRRECLDTESWSGITPACFNESEEIKDVANRLENQFLKKVAVSSSNSTSRARYLDAESLLNGLELVILVDRSSSVDPIDFESGKNFVKFLLQKFDIKNGDNPTGARAAILAFGTEVEEIFNVNDAAVVDPDSASKILDEKLQPGGGGTAMVPAFIDVYQKVVPLLRSDSKRALFLISDGDPPNIGGSEVDDMSNFLKEEASFEVFAVGIGRDINRQLFSRIASEPIINHVFLLENFHNLDEIIQIIENKPPEVPPPAPEKCGHLHDNPFKDSWPWNALIYISHVVPESNSSNLNLCGGVLLCREWVLTAASCFFDANGTHANEQLKEVFIIMGEKNLYAPDPKEMNFFAKKVVIHPRFNATIDLYNNLALVQLSEAAPIKDFRPVCLPPTAGIAPLYLNPALNASLCAWGLSRPKSELETITPTSTRQQSLMKTVVLVEEFLCRNSARRRIKGKNIFCASSGKDFSCLGNRGSPLVAQNPDSGVHHVIGILSQRTNCGTGLSQYTEVTEFVPWINNVTEKCHFQHWNAN